MIVLSPDALSLDLALVLFDERALHDVGTTQNLFQIYHIVPKENDKCWAFHVTTQLASRQNP